MSHPFEYRKPTDEQAAQMAALSELLKAGFEEMQKIPSSAERTLAIRKLQEARMWANVAILEIRLPQ